MDKSSISEPRNIVVCLGGGAVVMLRVDPLKSKSRFKYLFLDDTHIYHRKPHPRVWDKEIKCLLRQCLPSAVFMNTCIFFI